MPCIRRIAIYDLNNIIINAHTHIHEFIVHSNKYTSIPPPKKKRKQPCNQRLISFIKKKTVHKIKLFSSLKGTGSPFLQVQSEFKIKNLHHTHATMYLRKHLYVQTHACANVHQSSTDAHTPSSTPKYVRSPPYTHKHTCV